MTGQYRQPSSERWIPLEILTRGVAWLGLSWMGADPNRSLEGPALWLEVEL